MKKLISLCFGCVLALTAGCSAIPSKPGVMALPGVGLPFEQFETDNLKCESYASSRINAQSDAEDYELQFFYDVAYLQCMYGKGHRVPVSGQFSDPAQPSGAGANNGIPLPPEGAPPSPPPGKQNPAPAR